MDNYDRPTDTGRPGQSEVTLPIKKGVCTKNLKVLNSTAKLSFHLLCHSLLINYLKSRFSRPVLQTIIKTKSTRIFRRLDSNPTLPDIH